MIHCWHAGAIELLQTGRLPADFWDWAYGAGFSFDRDEADEGDQPAFAGPRSNCGAKSGSDGLGADLAAPFVLRSADGLASAFTNYVRGYAGLLDYVWYQPGRMCVRELHPPPGEAELAGWIPSARFPSDHLSVVADLEWLPLPESPTPPAPLSAAAAAAAGASRDAAPPGDAAAPRCEQNGSGASPAEAAGGGGQCLQQGAAEGSKPGVPAHAGLDRVSVPPRGAVLPADERGAQLAAAALGAGEVVAVPTDTLYGLACCANSEQARPRGCSALLACLLATWVEECALLKLCLNCCFQYNKGFQREGSNALHALVDGVLWHIYRRGSGGSLCRVQGVKRIYAIKHRQAHLPLAVCVADVCDVERYAYLLMHRAKG